MSLKRKVAWQAEQLDQEHCKVLVLQQALQESNSVALQLQRTMIDLHAQYVSSLSATIHT